MYYVPINYWKYLLVIVQEGQGLGKKEQGISVALQVEKTSKRGGRIIHEKPGGNVSPPPMASMATMIQDDFVAPAPPPPKPLQSITEIMKEQSKVILNNSFFVMLFLNKTCTIKSGTN